MKQRNVKAEEPRLFIGEPVSLDLLNTRHNQDGHPVDLIATAAQAQRWLRREAGRLPWHGRVTPSDLRALHALRDTLGPLFAALRLGSEPAAASIAAFNRILSEPTDTPQLGWDVKGPQPQADTAIAPINLLLHAIARDALQLLTGPDAARVRECAQPGCRLQFVARNPRRRWCSSATCGNRARVSRHYARSRVADK